LRKIPIELIATSEEIPELDVPYAEIRSPRYGVQVQGYVVCPKILGVYTHYYGNRTIPHLNDRTLCEGCQAERAKRWKGYLGLYNPAKKELLLGELTQYAALPWKKLLESGDCDLRGALAKITRLGRAVNSRCKLELTLRACKSEALPEAFQILPVLRKIWCGETPAKKLSGPSPATGEQIPI
jgi:hypothetical protein